VSAAGTASQRPLLAVKELQKFSPIRKGFWKRTVGYVRAVRMPSRSAALRPQSGKKSRRVTLCAATGHTSYS